MKTEFVPTAMCRINVPGGAMVRIVKYELEAFYLVETIPDCRRFIAHQDDMVLDPDKKVCNSCGDDFREHPQPYVWTGREYLCGYCDGWQAKFPRQPQTEKGKRL